MTEEFYFCIMKVSGFTFIRNAIKFDYPVVEAIKSILPLCDEFVVAVGNSEDQTLELISNIDPKIRIINTIWDDSLREGGRALAQETDKAFSELAPDSDWAFYIQGDEVIHEKYLETIKNALLSYKEDDRVEGLLFHYTHFFGSYDYVGTASSWYKNEIRIVKRKLAIFSFRDAQGFRKKPDEILKVKLIDAHVYHYGWVKPPEKMQKKQETFHKLWHEDEWLEKNIVKAESFDYESNINQLALFEGTHPEVMKERITAKNWKFDYDLSFNKVTPKEKIKSFLAKYLGLDFSYKNYKKI